MSDWVTVLCHSFVEWFMQEVKEMDTMEELIRRECNIWNELQAVPAYAERFTAQEQEEMDEFTKAAHACGECGRVYQWSADDIAWEYEKPFMPCGHLWRFLDKQV